MTRRQYGIMPIKPPLKCCIRGDAGIYDVWGFDWYEHRVLIGRACGNEWVSIDRVKFVPCLEVVWYVPIND